MRAESDAILIGATTLRSDNPRLIVKSPRRQTERETRELTACSTADQLCTELAQLGGEGSQVGCCSSASGQGSAAACARLTTRTQERLVHVKSKAEPKWPLLQAQLNSVCGR